MYEKCLKGGIKKLFKYFSLRGDDGVCNNVLDIKQYLLLAVNYYK